MNYTLLAAYMASIFLLIATPGPVVALVLNTASRHGVGPAFLSVLGTNSASLVLIGAAALVISGLLSVNTLVLQWISLVGCLYIGRLAITALYDDFTGGKADAGVAWAGGATPARRRSDLLNGFLIGIANPKDIIFFIAFFPQFMAITQRAEVSLAILTLIWIAFDFLILVGYVTAMKGDFLRRRRRWISALSAGFLLLVAIAGFTYSFVGIMT